jgi:threonine dehydratase
MEKVEESGKSKEDGDIDAETDMTLSDFRSAHEFIRSNSCTQRYRRTAMLQHWKDLGDCSTVSQLCDLYLKLENTQVTGSYKVRGLLNQLRHFRSTQQGRTDLVTMSAGNYGKTFAFLTAAADFDGVVGRRLVVMPSTAPSIRQTIIESYGAEVERVDRTDAMRRMDEIINDGKMFYMQSINDINLIVGHGSLGLEILEDVPEPDVILVPCGGGALLAGLAAAVKLSLKESVSHHSCRIYGVEPKGANTMWQSFRSGHSVTMPTARSIAAGLAPPYAGTYAYRLCRRFVDDILVVPDRAIVRAVRQLYGQGLVVEPSGAVGYAALGLGLVPDLDGKKVVVVVSGGNVSAEEMVELEKMAAAGTGEEEDEPTAEQSDRN